MQVNPLEPSEETLDPDIEVYENSTGESAVVTDLDLAVGNPADGTPVPVVLKEFKVNKKLMRADTRHISPDKYMPIDSKSYVSIPVRKATRNSDLPHPPVTKSGSTAITQRGNEESKAELYS